MVIVQRTMSGVPQTVYLVAIQGERLRYEMFPLVNADVRAFNSEEGLTAIFQREFGPIRLAVQHPGGYYLLDRISIDKYHKTSRRSQKLPSPIAYYQMLERIIRLLGFRDTRISKSNAPAPLLGVEVQRWEKFLELDDKTQEYKIRRREKSTAVAWLDKEHGSLLKRMYYTVHRQDWEMDGTKCPLVLSRSFEAKIEAYGRHDNIWYPKIVQISKKDINQKIEESRWEILRFCTHSNLPMSLFTNGKKLKGKSAWSQVSKWLSPESP